MFKHSVRVPRHFKIAANIVKKVTEEGGSIKTLLYDDKLKHFRTDVLYALVNETIKHAVDIEKIFESTGILVNEPRLDPWLARVLTAELIYGKKSLPGQSKPEQTILAYKERFEKFTPEDNQKTQVRRPRYIRVNTNLLSTSDAIRAFQDEGYKFIRCPSGSYNDYLQIIQSLTENDFTQDYHVKTILVFAPGTKWHEHEMYLENKILLQDKATALPVHLLAAPQGSVVMDMCAAPGMKTTQLAAHMRNEGKIYAVERIEHRYKTLCEFVKATGCKCVETYHIDALQIRRGDMDDVQYILLDPSCSGSGMELCTQTYTDAARLKKLTNFQEKFLKHAMNSFPNAKRIVYSTCSVFPEENERVITNIVKASRAKWRVRDVKDLLKGQWNNFGSGMYGSMGTRCVYARPDTDFTTGFFVAVLDREFSENQQIESKIITQKNENHKILEHKHKNDDTDNNLSDEGKQISKKSKKKKRNDESNTEYETNSKQSQDNINNEQDDLKSKKKKRKKNSENFLDNASSPDEITIHNSERSQEHLEHNGLKCKKKKRNKDISNEDKLTVNVNCDEITKISEESHESQNVKSKKKKCKDATFHNELDSNMNCDELFPISEDTNEIPNVKKKKKKHKESENHILESVIESSENNLNGNISCDKVIEISKETHETQNLKKKKKKRKDNENNSVEFIDKSVIAIATDKDKPTFEENQLLKNDNETDELKVKRKKRKELDDETLEAVSSKVIDISSDAEQTTSKKGKKRKNCSLNESSIIEITDEEKQNDFDEVEIIESHELVDDKNTDHNAAKCKKKKRKFREEEIEEAVTITADTLKYKKKSDMESKKKKKERDNSSLFISDAIQDGTKSKTKKIRGNKSNFEDYPEITEEGENSQAPKKKKKNRELEIS